MEKSKYVRKGGPSGFVASVVHYRTGKRIFPKRAKAFPIWRPRSTPGQMKLGL